MNFFEFSSFDSQLNKSVTFAYVLYYFAYDITLFNIINEFEAENLP